MNKKSAIAKINKQGVLLVFPILNRKEPDSLWAQFFPRKKMKWEWNDNGDDTVAKMWMLMKKLSDCREVVYSKWYQGRATFFSVEVFASLLAILKANPEYQRGLSRTAQHIYEILLDNSPLSTKELKKVTELQGKDNEAAYNKACKELFSKLLIVAYGEVDDGAFPSLAVGATKVLYDDIWRQSDSLTPEQAYKTLEKYMPIDGAFRKYWDKLTRQFIDKTLTLS